jgi:protein O-mannosyl-transferase
MAKKRKNKKNTPDRSRHLKPFKDVAHPLTGEENKIIKVAICLFLMVATFCIYSQVQDHEFIYFDDDVFVTDNLNVQAGLTRESINWALTTSYASNWYPMTWLSYMLDYQLYGLNPKGFLLTNLFFHIANSLLLFLILFRMTGAIWQSAFVATLFAFHPFNVESVAWVAERKNVLSTFFLLLTIWAYIHYAAKPTIKSYGLVFLFFTLGLMSKPMLVTLPFVLLLLDYWPLGRLKLEQERGSNEFLEKNTTKRSDLLQLVREKIPLFLLATGAGIVSFIVQKSGGALQS